MSDIQNKDSNKKIISKQEFFELNRKAADAMHSDGELQQDALDILVKADDYRWIHQSTWFGEPVLNLPQDMFALQEIIWQTRPDFIIEVGVAWGGGILFEAMLLEVLGGKKVIGIDIFIPPDLRKRLENHGAISNRIDLIEGSSISAETLAKVKELLRGSKKVLVVLDSHHTHDHVLEELRAYAPLVEQGQYLICGDTIVERMPPHASRPRPWGPGNSPATALQVFLKETDRFVANTEIDKRLLFSCHPGGYLRAVK